MPSSRSVAHVRDHLRLPNSRVMLGVAAAAAAAVATVGGGPASAATTGGTPSPAAKVSHTTAFSAYTLPGQQAAPSIRIGEGMQLISVPAPGHATAARPASAAPQLAATAAAAPATSSAPSATPAVAATPAAAPTKPAAPAPPPAPPQPYQLYDSVTPSAIPGSSQAVAVYANGQYAAQPQQVGKRGLTLWIDTNGSDPHADVLDVEPGDATPDQAAAWVQQKLNAHPNSTAIIYTMLSQWGPVQDAVSHLAWWMPSHTKYWIADPTGVPHIVPGSAATQWYWGQNYDVSNALPSFN